MVFFIFGATGDLARRKLFPAIYSLYRERRLNGQFAVIGLARSPRTDEQFRQEVRESIRKFSRFQDQDADEMARFLRHFRYMPLDIHNPEGFKRLKELCEETEKEFDIPQNRMFYLALSPELFGTVTNHLRQSGLTQTSGWARLIIEKPFGYDLKSARELNEQIRQTFKEEQIYRIDHYLGKEMVQNIEVLRFTNAFFEPIWNNKHIANVQITLSETVGVEERGEYYDKSGALRDMVQNHMLQMITMIAMEPPAKVHPESIRDEKVKVLRSLRAYESAEEVRKNVIRGQYTKGRIQGVPVPGYREEQRIRPDSNTETFFAAKVFVDNFRWAGVPFYVRTGKRLPVKSTEVVVEFKNIPKHVYLAKKFNLEPNLLVIRVHPMEGIYFKLNMKKPGSGGLIVPMAVDFCQSAEVGLNTPEAYERLLYDAFRGDSTHFTRWDEVALAWKFVDVIAKAWQQLGDGDLHFYPAGTWGPLPAQELPSEDGYRWWPVFGQEDTGGVWVYKPNLNGGNGFV